jgi:hypothetical protein
VERQWSLPEALLDGVHHQFLRATTSEDIHPELLPIATGALRLSFLYGVFEAREEAHARTKAEDGFDRTFLLGMSSLLYDKAFEALREFLTDVHYTHSLEDEPTALSITDTSLLHGVVETLLLNSYKARAMYFEPSLPAESDGQACEGPNSCQSVIFPPMPS